MELVNKFVSGVELLSTKAGNSVYRNTLKKVATQEALNKSSQEVINAAVKNAALDAAKKGELTYELTKAGIYGSAIGGTVGLINNIGNNDFEGTITGTGLGAIGGAGVGSVAAAIAKGIR